eukprot:2485332-Prorocentrum_lima.AAC.1
MVSASSRRQTCVSHSTPEAEYVAGDYAIRAEGLPHWTLWENILGRTHFCRRQREHDRDGQ